MKGYIVFLFFVCVRLIYGVNLWMDRPLYSSYDLRAGDIVKVIFRLREGITYTAKRSSSLSHSLRSKPSSKLFLFLPAVSEANSSANMGNISVSKKAKMRFVLPCVVEYISNNIAHISGSRIFLVNGREEEIRLLGDLSIRDVDYRGMVSFSKLANIKFVYFDNDYITTNIITMATLTNSLRIYKTNITITNIIDTNQFTNLNIPGITNIGGTNMIISNITITVTNTNALRDRLTVDFKNRLIIDYLNKIFNLMK